MGRLGWLIRRLAVMGPREVMHRAGALGGLLGLLRRHWMRGLRKSAVHAGSLEFCTAEGAMLPELPWDFSMAEEGCRALIAGEAGALGYPWRWRPGIWQRAPDTGNDWPAEFFAGISYRPGNPHGDARVVWEPSRLQHLIGLALAARRGPASCAEAAYSALEIQLTDWVDRNPPYAGIHYVSAMECALRLIAVCHAFDMARDFCRQSPRICAAVAEIAGSHCALIERRLSLHSSAGNHTIAEAAGLVYAGLLFPELPRAARWRRMGLELLRREAARQILQDGGGIEQAFWYHRFVLDLLGIVAALLAYCGEPIPSEIASALTRGRSFLQAVSDHGGALPAVGDSDDGYALSPYLAFDQGRAPSGLRRFDDAGYSVLRQDAPVPLTLLLDHGPLGMATNYGHGHADALSLILSVGETPALIDPGTFAYGGDPEWRRYFRSTAAHNTVTVDGADQARQVSPFQWTDPYRCALIRSETGAAGEIHLLARHDGYRNRSVTHWRGVSFQPPGRIVVWDHVGGGANHTVAVHWHCVSLPQRTPGGYRLDLPDGVVTLAVSGGETVCLCGDKTPPAGWRAPRYGVLEPGAVLRTEYCGAMAHVFITRIGIGEEPPSDTEASECELLMRGWIDDAAAH